ncbi:MAG TPA: Ig-like domain-containing protein [Candidatus Saccharimonadales bacterium]|nr:Ig-like domain-containing protein [Candidatus Saccharimonadales bacterium]
MRTPKTKKRREGVWQLGWQRRGARPLLSTAHVVELVLAIIIFAAGQSLWTTFVRAAGDITPPSVPANLALTGRSATEIDISWDASTDDTAVAGYHVFRDGVQVGTVASPSYSDTALNPNTNYSYTVSAFDAVPNESSQSSALATATLADTSPPSVPTNVHQTGQTTSTITVAWNAASDNVGVTAYDIYRNGSLIRSQAGTSYTDSGLAVFATYSYTVRARDAAGNASNLSSALFASTAQDTAPPSVPDNIHETGSTVSSVSLAWNDSTDDVGVAGYHIYRNGSLIATQGGTIFTDTGLSVNSDYSYTISAFDAAANTSAQSATFSASSSTDTTPPTIPANLRLANPVRDNAIDLTWDASTDDVAVTGYKIYRDGNLVGTSPSASFTDSGLQPTTQYTYTVKAYDAANNNSVASAALQPTTAFDTTTPTVPTSLRTTAATDNTISLAWDAASDNIQVAGYNVYRDGHLVTSTSGTTFTDSGLSVSTHYSYTVEAYDESSNVSGQSGALDGSTIADSVAPSTPAGLSSTAQTTTSIGLTWNAATDDVAVASYNLYRDGHFVTNVSGLIYTDGGLTYNTSYNYTVESVDASGNVSTASVAFVVSTLPDTTPPTVALTAPGNGQTLQLTFPISATASDDLALKEVDFYVDGSLISSVTHAPFALNWDSYAVHNGSHTITAKAVDATGNFATQSAGITINNPQPPITGDLNGDHKVNILDLSVLLSHWNKSGAGDFNNNGRVDIFDLSVLLSHYGQDNSNYN